MQVIRRLDHVMAPVEDQHYLGWGDLPPDLIAAIGGQFECPRHVDSASLVCKAWQQAIPTGVQSLEVDMNPHQDAWHAKVEQLGQLVPSLSSCKAYVSNAVPQTEFAENIKQLARQLHNIQVMPDNVTAVIVARHNSL